MKSGVRAVGVAESYRGDRSTFAAAVVRADRIVEGFRFGSCTVGGTDATETVVDLLSAIDREDVGLAVVAGIAPAWFNVLDLHTIHEGTGLGILSVSFEESEGLEEALHEHFEGEALEKRLAVYERQPPRRRVETGETVFVRSVGVENPAEVVRTFTPEGGRPEPVRVARLAARGADRWVRD